MGGNPFSRADYLGLSELILFSVNDGNFHERAMGFDSPDGVYTVAGHGNPSEMRNEMNRTVTPENLRDMITGDRRYQRAKVVLLLSCEVGRGENSFAQKLANLLNKPVVAPDNFSFISESGRGYAADADPSTLGPVPGTTGNWITFFPKK